MDPISLVFYAIVCGCLGYAAPRFGGPGLRLAIGALVGIAAASVLPLIRTGLAPVF